MWFIFNFLFGMVCLSYFFFFNDTATTEIYTLSLHDALPIFPMIEEIEFRWSGQVVEPVDSLAFIGRNPDDDKNVFIATGDSGMGMTHGTIAGMLLTDLIVGRETPWTELYNPSRKTAAAVKDFVEENVDVATQYADLVTPGEVDSIDEIAKGTGAVVRTG